MFPKQEFQTGEATKAPNQDPNALLSLLEGFLLYGFAECNFSKETIIKYGDCIRQVAMMIGNRAVTEFTREDILLLKSKMIQKGNGPSRQCVILLSLKRLLQYCRDVLGYSVLDPGVIVAPRKKRKEVLYLTPDEVDRFVGAIRLRTYRGTVHHTNLRFRAFCEVLLGSAMRISEVLSLKRSQVDFKNQEAKIIGKGSKERTVFFTDRALFWLNIYLENRTDDHPALFVRMDGRDFLKRTDIWRFFDRFKKAAGITKKVTPHILRHTAATQLLFNGCPIGHIKEILGHERLETTCRYYLGLDHRAAKDAHLKYLSYGPATVAAR